MPRPSNKWRDGSQPLDGKEELFCLEYMLDFNKSRAVRAAGYVTKWAAHYGRELLEKPHVAKRVAYLTNEMISDKRKTFQKMLERLQIIALGDPAEALKAVKGDGNEFHIEELSHDVRLMIRKVRPTKFGIEVDFHDPLRAIELFGKHLGQWTEKVEHKHDLAGMTDEELKAEEERLEAKLKGF